MSRSPGACFELHTIPPQNCHEVAARVRKALRRGEPTAWVWVAGAFAPALIIVVGWSGWSLSRRPARSELVPGLWEDTPRSSDRSVPEQPRRGPRKSMDGVLIGVRAQACSGSLGSRPKGRAHAMPSQAMASAPSATRRSSSVHMRGAIHVHRARREAASRRKSAAAEISSLVSITWSLWMRFQGRFQSSAEGLGVGLRPA